MRILKAKKASTPLKIAAQGNEPIYSAVLLKKDDELTAQINSALKSLKQKGVLKEISLKYFGKDITE